MPHLLPFPHYAHPPGVSVSALPVCREGIACIPPEALVRREGPAFGGLHFRRHRTGKESRALCGLLPSTAFLDGTVLPHEKTLESRLARQEQLVRADKGALGKPVLLVAPDLEAVRAQILAQKAVPELVVDFTGDENHYALQHYAADRPLDLSGAGQLIIADGHHRAATHARLFAAGYEPCRYVPVCILPAAEVHIGSFLRCLATGMTDAAELLDRLRPHFTIHPTVGPAGPRRAGEWTLAFHDHFFRLEALDQPRTQTAVRWLNDTVLPAAFDLHDARTDPRLTYSILPDEGRGGFPEEREPGVAYLRGKAITVPRFFAEVRRGGTLPPKSTRFEPRVPSGMMVWRP